MTAFRRSDDASRDPGETWDFHHLVFALVRADTADAAVASGAVAFRAFIDLNDSPLDDCPLVYDFDEGLTTTIRRRWGDVPPVVSLAAFNGRRLLQLAKIHAFEQREESTIPYFIDMAGYGITDEASLAERLLDDAGQWLVPALGLTRVATWETHLEPIDARDQRAQGRHYCPTCRGMTRQAFVGRETLEKRVWPGQPIWHCLECDHDSYGPEPN